MSFEELLYWICMAVLLLVSVVPIWRRKEGAFTVSGPALVIFMILLILGWPRFGPPGS